ncbi:MAG: integrase arm-type DNA-binding domain-containing protein [Erythrobacter sp.]|jgi:integrase|nr:integrase arm-type DNA-binding domain-containing protein [Erythrobacter sp.]
MARALTTKAVEAVKPSDKRQEIPDGIVSGLYLVVQPSGAKSWALRYRHAGKPCKLTLGRWPMMGVKNAREAAGVAIDAVERGGNPAVMKKATKAAQQVAQIEGRNKVRNLLDQFEKRHLSKLKSGKQCRDFLDRFVLEPWGDREVQSIAKRDIIELLDGIADSGRGTSANRVLAHLRKFLNWCVERDILEVSPALGVKPPVKENQRERVLSDEEIRLFWQACEDVGQPFGPLGKLLLLTGQRRGEVSEMTEGELSGDTWHLTAKRTKNGRAHDVPITRAAGAVLVDVKRFKGEAGYIFTTTGTTPVSGFSKAHGIIAAKMAERASEAAGGSVTIEHWTWHDLRRTCETGMARLGIPQEIIDRVTNHVSGQHRMVRVYNHHDYANKKREALEAWGDAVADILAGRDPVAEKKRRDDDARALEAQEALEAKLALEAKRAQDAEIEAADNVVKLAGVK